MDIQKKKNIESRNESFAEVLVLVNFMPYVVTMVCVGLINVSRSASCPYMDATHFLL